MKYEYSTKAKTGGLTWRINETTTMQSLLRCYCAEAGYYWSNQLDMIEFRYNSFPSENTSTLLHLNQAMDINRLLLLIGSMVPFDDIELAAVDRLTKLADTQAAVKERLKLSTDREAAWRTKELAYL